MPEVQLRDSAGPGALTQGWANQGQSRCPGGWGFRCHTRHTHRGLTRRHQLSVPTTAQREPVTCWGGRSLSIPMSLLQVSPKRACFLGPTPVCRSLPKSSQGMSPCQPGSLPKGLGRTSQCRWHLNILPSLPAISILFFFFFKPEFLLSFFFAVPWAYGSSWARDRIESKLLL